MTDALSSFSKEGLLHLPSSALLFAGRMCLTMSPTARPRQVWATPALMAFMPSLEKHPGSLLPLDTALRLQNDSRGIPSAGTASGQADRQTDDQLEESPEVVRAAFLFVNGESGQRELVVGDQVREGLQWPIKLQHSPDGIPLCFLSPDTALGMIISIGLPHEKSSLAVRSSHSEENMALATTSAEPLATEAGQAREPVLLAVDLSR